MAKRMSAGGKAALITGACLIGLAAVGTGLYFGVAAIREKVDDAAARTGKVTLVDLFDRHQDDFTDAERAVWSEEKRGTYTALAGTNIEYKLVGYAPEKADVKARQLVLGAVVTSGETYGMNCLKVAGDPNFSVNVTTASEVFGQTKLYLDGIYLDKVSSPACTFSAVHVYDLDPLGFVSLKKSTYVYQKLTKALDVIDGDLTFSKADVLKYADAYEESIKAASSSAASTAASSSAA